MFAGAAREAVFSQPKVIDEINANFIPVALKAGKVANPPLGVEGKIYRHLKATRAAPQGIAVLNSSGSALVWSLMFKNDDELLNFFDYGRDRFVEMPHSTPAFLTKRFRRFPDAPMPDITTDAPNLRIPLLHAAGERCPGLLNTDGNHLMVQIVGRAFTEDGKPLSETKSQDNYIEDLVEIPESVLANWTDAIPNQPGRFPMPEELARIIVKGAHLGQLDVQPLDPQRGVVVKTTKAEIRLWTEAIPEQPSLFQIGGTSSIAGHDAVPGRQMWDSEIGLKWQGFITIKSGKVSEIVLSAEGTEMLRWGDPAKANKNPVASLPGGSPMKFQGPVRYGLIGTRD